MKKYHNHQICILLEADIYDELLDLKNKTGLSWSSIINLKLKNYNVQLNQTEGIYDTK